MPIQHSLTKVQKTIQKSKGAMHPKGRKFKQLNRATLREGKIQTKKSKHHERKEVENLRYVFLQEAVQNRPDNEVFTMEDMELFIEAFLTRDDEEIEQLQSDRRKGRPPTNRHSLLENKRREEQQEYDSGYEIPDLRDKLTVELLRSWNGTTGMFNKFKHVYVAKRSESVEAEAPPQDDDMEE